MPPRIPPSIVSHVRSATSRTSYTTAPKFISRSASYYAPQAEKKGIKVGHLFTGLALVGITATSYGLYQFYSTFTTYPNTSTHPIRTQLRAALRSATTTQYTRAATSFETAYLLSLDLASQGALGSREEGLMKTTGIAVKWGGMWEEAGERGKAIEVYERGYKEISDLMELDDVHLNENEIMRGVALAMKLGDLWVEVGGKSGEKEAERHYVWSVEEMMRLSMSDGQKDKVKEEMEHGTVAEGGDKIEKEMDLPKWLGRVELVAGFERLGELYSRTGKVEYAQPLLQQAIATLLPPPPKDGSKAIPPPIATRCHAATLMNNLSSSFVLDPSPTAAQIDQAARWARQALNVSNACRKEADNARKSVVIPLNMREEQECELVAVVGAYNLGKLSELSKDKVSAKQWFEKSRTHAARLGIEEGVTRSTEAIRRL